MPTGERRELGVPEDATLSPGLSGGVCKTTQAGWIGRSNLCRLRWETRSQAAGRTPRGQTQTGSRDLQPGT